MDNISFHKPNSNSIVYFQQVFLFLFFLFFLFLPFLGLLPAAYGGSQARGLIGAVAADLRHSHSKAGSEPCRDLYHSSRQCQIFNPLSKATDQTHNLMVPGQIR